MKHVIDDQVVLSRVPEGPLAPYLAPFATSLQQKGYTRPYVHRHVRLAASFSQWLKQRRVRLRRLKADHAAQYLQWRHRRRRPDRGDPAALDHILEFLRGERVLPAEKPAPAPRTPAGAWVQAYAQYLRERPWADRGDGQQLRTVYRPTSHRAVSSYVFVSSWGNRLDNGDRAAWPGRPAWPPPA